MLLLAASSAIVLPLLLLALFKMSAKYAMSLAALAVTIIALTIWGMSPLAVGASALQGTHRAVTIIWILIGAVTLLHTVQRTGAVERIRAGFMSITEDMRIQVVIVGFAFLSLIEGASGFGTPAVVVAPLLIALGFRPVVAASIALISDTVACTFGAVGTPLIVGLENVSTYSPELVGEVARLITVFDLVIGSVLPLALVYVLVMWFAKDKHLRSWRHVRAVAPWALMVGVAYSVTAFMVVRVLGVEFAAIIAGSTALVVSIVSAKYRLLLPLQKAWRDDHSGSAVEPRGQCIPDSKASMTLLQAWSPYLLIVALLLVSRIVVPIRDLLLMHIDLSWSNILGFESINSAWQILYSPGTVLLLAALLASLVQSRSATAVMCSIRSSLAVAVGATFALLPTLVMVQVFTNSGINTSGLQAMPVLIGEALAGVAGESWLFVAPLLGGLGAFIAGSATVSNLTMASVQEGAAASANLPLVLVLAMQVLGAVAGNIIAIHNVVAAAAVVGLTRREGYIIRRVLPAAAIYVAAVTCLGYLYLIVSRL